MKTLMTLMILLTVLVFHGYCYSLEGRWNVKSQYLPANSSVSISFDKQLNEENNRIQYFMNIFACKLVRYKYIVVDNEIYFTFDAEVTKRYECKPNEIQSIKSIIQRSFYFIIIGTQLSLYGPNNEAQIKLTRVIQVQKSLSGEWLSVDVSGSPISESISISESQFELCGGKGVVSYSYSELSKPVVSFKVMKTTGCVQNEIYSSLSRSVFMRWKGSSLVYLYNGDFEQIMTIRRIGDRIVNNSNNISINNSNNINSNVSTVQNSSSSNVNSKTNNNVTNINNSNNNANSNNAPINQSQSTTINKLNNSSSTQQNTTNQINNVQTQNQTQTQNVQIINQQQSSSSSSPSSSSSIPTNTNTKPTTQSQSSITKYSTVADLPPITKSDLQGKWIIKDNPQFSSSSYFFLILPDKIMLYGGCNVHFSSYTLTQTILNNINLQSTSKSCPQLTQPFKSLIEKFKSWKYLALKNLNNKPILQILDSKFIPLNNLQKVA